MYCRKVCVHKLLDVTVHTLVTKLSHNQAFPHSLQYPWWGWGQRTGEEGSNGPPVVANTTPIEAMGVTNGWTLHTAWREWSLSTPQVSNLPPYLLFPTSNLLTFFPPLSCFLPCSHSPFFLPTSCFSLFFLPSGELLLVLLQNVTKSLALSSFSFFPLSFWDKSSRAV